MVRSRYSSATPSISRPCTAPTNAVSSPLSRPSEKASENNPNVSNKQVYDKLTFSHKPLRLIDDNVKPFPDFCQIYQGHLVVDGEIKRPSDRFDFNKMPANSCEPRANVPPRTLIRPHDCTDGFRTFLNQPAQRGLFWCFNHWCKRASGEDAANHKAHPPYARELNHYPRIWPTKWTRAMSLDLTLPLPLLRI